MSDPNTPNGASSGAPRDPSVPASDDFDHSSDATQLWGPEESPPGASASLPDPGAQASDAADPASGTPSSEAVPFEPATPEAAPPVTPEEAAFAAGETAEWPTVDAAAAAQWSPAAGAAATADQLASDTAPDLAAAGGSGPEPWEAPQAPGALHTASLARGVSAGRPQAPDDPGTPKGRPVAIVGGVIGAAIAVAAGAWFFLLNPSQDNTAGASPTPSAIVTPGPTATAEATLEPTEEPTPAPTAFRAPRFTGRTVDEAEELAAAGGLQLRMQFDETTSEPDGTILAQDPPPGAAVRPGDTIVLTVARSGPTVLVPDLVGEPEEDGLNLLLDADLAPGQRSETFDALIPTGSIVSTDPVADAEVERQSEVDYVVSLGAEPTPAPVALPELRGVAESDAVNALLDLGLEPGERSEEFDTDIPNGAIISTDPEAGTELPIGTTVDYVVSIGPEPTPTPEPTPAPVFVPDLRGVAESDAVNELLDLGLEPGDRSEAFDAEVTVGAIVSTDPEADTELPVGSTVDYVVSLGVEPTPTPEPTPAPVAVPDLRGVAESDAVNQLLDLGLEPGDRSEAFDAEVTVGAVISTDPEADTELPVGGTVDYVVSLGVEPTPTPEPTPAPVGVPDLRGVAESDAINQLLDLGLEPGDRSEAFDTDIPNGAVVSTDPEAGTELPIGSTIDYVVSVGPEPTPTPEPTPAPVAVPDLRGVAEADAVNQLLDLGFQPGARGESFHAEIASGAIVSTDPEADTELPIGSTVDYVVSLGPEPTPTPEPTPAPVAVPDLRGVAESDAVNQLLDLGLQPGERSERFHEDVAAGAVISTDPEADTELPIGSTVDYVVSVGPEPTPTPEPTPAPVAVPDLRGVAEPDAVNQLLDLGLQPGERSEAFHSDIAGGAVIRTDPEAGTELPVGSTVDYVVSVGPEPTPTPEPTPAPVAVPDLRGVAESDAVNQLLDLGLQPGERSEAFDTDIPNGAVISTDPDTGVELPVGSTVHYVVSLGVEPTPTPEPTPAPVAVPDLRGVAESDAVNQLLDLGLQPGERSERFHENVAAGAVISTDPEAGTELPVGSTVDYVVSVGPEPTPTPEPTPAPVAVPDLRGVAEPDAVNQLLDLGLQPGERSERFHDSVSPGAVISTDPDTGVELPVGSTVDYVVSVGPEPTPTPEPTPAPVAVPDLRGVAESDAVNQLLDLGLQPGERSERFHEDVAAGAVIRTDPEAGTELPVGSTVDYVVSVGPEPTPTPEPTPAPVAIPDLRGVAEADAVNQLLDLGLQPGERSERFHENVAAGAVIRTDPEAGTELPVGSTVDYVVSVGPEPTPTPEPTPAPVAIPDLRGVAEADAVNQLLDLGLQPGERSERFHENVAAGAVIRTDPEAGTEVSPGSVVAYFVSVGPEPTPTPEPTPAPVAIPDLRGVAEADAVNQLLDLGLQPGERSERFHENVAAGAVIRTDPPAGTEVGPGAVVSYVVSRGAEPTPAPITIPDLRGEPEEDALQRLRELGLEPGTRRERFHASVPIGAILRTDPASGTDVASGSVVDYFVSKGPEATPEPTPARVEVPNLRGSSPDDAVNALLDAGLTPGERRNRYHDSVPRGEVIRTDPASGERVDLGATVDYFVSRGPQPTDEPTPEPTTSSSDPQAVIDAVASQVETIRELDAREDVPYREISRREFRALVEEQFDEENPRRRLAAEETFLKRMGLIPRDMDLRATMLDLYESQVAAFYDPATGAMTVIGDQDDLGAADRLFISHEYDHALQDQYWDLEDVTDVSPSQGDRALARLALIEGDATNVMYQWAMENLGPDDIAELTDAVSTMDQDLLNDMPPIIRRQLEMPYLDGQAFVAALRQAGGWGAVNDAWERLPASTEQILHPERYPSDRPASVSLPDVARALGEGWTDRYTQTMGELATRILLADGGSESDVAHAAEGWGGDRLVMVEGPDGAWAIVWQTAWDSGDEAQQFVDAAGLGSTSGVHTVLPGIDVTGEQDAPVLVLIASDDATLTAVQDALGVSEVVLQ